MNDGEIVENKKLNLGSGNVSNCENAIPMVNEFDNIIKCKKKRILNLAYKRGILFKKSKESDRFKETLKGMLQPMLFIDINTNRDRKWKII